MKFCVSLIVLLLTCMPESAGAQDATARRLKAYQAQVDRERERFQKQMGLLSEKYRLRGRSDAVEAIRQALLPEPDRVTIAMALPETVLPAISPTLSPDERTWRLELRAAREKHATTLYSIARRALTAKLSGFALGLIPRVAYHNPDHVLARRMLGFTRYQDRWVTPYAEKMLRTNHVWDDRFGWILKSHLDRYEAGERFYRGQWMPVEREAEIRRDFDHAWTVRTDHFLITTNVSLERGVEIASALETYHRYFLLTFAGFFTTAEQIQYLFRSTSAHAPKPPHQVHVFRTKEEYVSRLKSKIPQIAITNGLYYTSDRTSYFYHDPDHPGMETVYHEATHQLFYESQDRHRPIATDANFWIVEGIACYMESFSAPNDKISIGSPTYIRFQNAWYRLTKDRFYVPLAKLAQQGNLQFQSNQQLPKFYSQSSGLAHFFMHYRDGLYRDALVEHLSQIYRQTGRRRTPVMGLDRLTGVSYDVLDRQYIEYMKEFDPSKD